MATTYEAIQTTTLGSAAALITFSSIPATYTDLILVLLVYNLTRPLNGVQFNLILIQALTILGLY
jgi:hypothetical protein